jgi:hypothetical protein
MTDMTRPEIDAKFAASEAKLDVRLANIETSLKTGFSDLRAEMRTEIANLRTEFHKSAVDIIKWGIVTALGFATVTVSILTFVINNAGRQAAPQPVPIIITVPGAIVAPAAPPAGTK